MIVKPEIQVIINRLMGPTPKTTEDHVLARAEIRKRLASFFAYSIEVSGYTSDSSGLAYFHEQSDDEHTYRAIIPRALILPIEKEQEPTEAEIIKFFRDWMRDGTTHDEFKSMHDRLTKHGIRKDGEK